MTNPESPEHLETQPDVIARLERRLAHFRRITDYAPMMLWTTDETGAATYFNRVWLQFTGLEDADVLDGGWGQSLHQDYRAQTHRTFMEALNSRSQYRAEYPLRRNDGQFRNMLAIGEPLIDEAGEFLGYTGCTVDISDQKENEKVLSEFNGRLKKHATEISLLNELNDNLQVCKNVDETKPILKRYGTRIFPDVAVDICLFNESRNLVEPFVNWGTTQGNLPQVFAPDHCWALRKSKPHFENPLDEGQICPNFANCNHVNYICVPMMAYGEVVGNMHIDVGKQFEGLNDDAVLEKQNELSRLASHSSDQIALALANLKLRATLQYQSTRDPLTRLFNRRYMLETLEREIARAVRSQTALSVLMLDVDHFKRFNDSYGHEAGDLVLRELATVLRHAIRGSDIVARYGGEEFIVVMPDADTQVASGRAEEIRKRVASLTIDNRGQSLGNVTLSIGVSTLPANGESSEQLIGAADSALYNAKGEGRNCVVVAPATGPPMTLPSAIAS
ncbi:MAG: diguanylate cyclase [Pseudomonadota bacterium]